MWDAGCRLPTQMADGRSRCFCGAQINLASRDQHIYAAHMEQGRMKFVADYAALDGDLKRISPSVLGAKLSDPLFASVAAECRRQ
jgi:hypothetical protein